MKKNRGLVILAASVLAASQITTAVFAASEINGSVHVNGDEAWAGNSEGSEMLEGESGSVTNTEGGAAVTVTGITEEQDGKESLSFTVDGNVSSDNSAVTPVESAPDDGGPDGYPSYEGYRYGDYPVTGVKVTVPEPDKEAGSVKDTILEVTGNISANGIIDNGGSVKGMGIDALGGQSQDQSLTVTADGDVKVSDGALGNNVVGVEIATIHENDDWEEAPEAPSDTHTMTTKVTAGSVTVDGGPESTATGLYIYAGSDHAVQDVTVDVKGNINVSGQEGQTVSGINLSQGGANDSSVNISVGGSVVLDGKGYSSDGVRISHIMSTNGETSAKIDIKENLTVKSDGEESFVKGVAPVESEMAGNLDIHVGEDVAAEAVSEATGLNAVKTTDNGTAEIKVDGDVTATATGTEGSAVAIFADISQYSGTGDVLVGKNATASGADSNGIMMNLDITPKDNEEGAAGSGSAGASNKEPVRIEVLGTVDGGADGNDLLIRVTDCNVEWVYDNPDDPTQGTHEETREPMAAADVKTALTGSLPEIVTHELKNGSIKAVMKSDNADNEKAALEALTEMIFYTVNYATKVTDETGAEDDSLGTITITQYDGKDLEKKELRYDGSTAYVAKAGDKILIDVKVKNGYVDKDREEKVTGTSEVKTEETDTEIITTTTTPVTRKTWTERTAYELDLDKLKIVDELGYDATVKLVKETSTAGGVTWSLEVTPVGSIDLDIEAIIKAITSEINLQEITENIVKVDKKAKEVKPDPEKQNDQKQEEVKPEEWTEGWIKDQKGWRYIVGNTEKASVTKDSIIPVSQPTEHVHFWTTAARYPALNVTDSFRIVNKKSICSSCGAEIIADQTSPNSNNGSVFRIKLTYFDEKKNQTVITDQSSTGGYIVIGNYVYYRGSHNQPIPTRLSMFDLVSKTQKVISDHVSGFRLIGNNIYFTRFEATSVGYGISYGDMCIMKCNLDGTGLQEICRVGADNAEGLQPWMLSMCYCRHTSSYMIIRDPGWSSYYRIDYASGAVSKSDESAWNNVGPENSFAG
ncbi:MAG: hypothetical protein IKE31_06090 [Eubacterium sp.]|nr:hypothetical protein [Eubacterium sp.]